MRKRYKSLLSWALAAALTAGLLPAPVAYAADTANIKTVMLGTDGIETPDDYENQPDQNERLPKSYIYFGKNSANLNKPIQWRVLDAENTSDTSGKQGMFLFSERALAETIFDFDGVSNLWEGDDLNSPDDDSDVKKWCADFVKPANNNFTQAENKAMLETSRDENTTVTGQTFFGASWWLDSKRVGDKAFFLSVKELNDYVAKQNRKNGLQAQKDDTNSEGAVTWWWLISPTYGNGNDIGMVNPDGDALDGYVGGYNRREIWARPALNLNRDSILFTSAAEGGKSASGMDTDLKAVSDYEANNTGAREWKLTILDDNRKFAISDVGIQGSSVGFSYADAETGGNEYISAIIKENGAITHYGRILKLDGTANGASGTASLTLPDGVTLGNETELYVFNEQYNGGTSDNTKLSDYGSQLVEVENTAPTLTKGNASRTSETAATVTFTSNEAGQYYYSVVEKDAAAPTIDTSGTGTACDTSETIFIDNLNGSGAKDIYIKVKDAAGNVSDALKMDIPAYVPPTPPAPEQPDPAPSGDNWTPSAPTPSTYAPSINQTDGGTVTVNPARPQRGDTVTITATPDAGKRVSFVGATDRNGNVIPVTDNGNGTWSFIQPNSIVTVGVVFRDAVEPWRNPFGDVQEGDWFYSAVEYVITHDLMNGVSFSTFAPDAEATRAMLWAILARMDGATIAGADWMAQAGAWATSAGVSDGTNPSGALTREQLVTMLWRAAGSPPPRGDLSAFADADSVSDYARAPMAWATENGIVSGMGGNRLAPQAGATRAQLAAMLQRYAER